MCQVPLSALRAHCDAPPSAPRTGACWVPGLDPPGRWPGGQRGRRGHAARAGASRASRLARGVPSVDPRRVPAVTHEEQVVRGVGNGIPGIGRRRGRDRARRADERRGGREVGIDFAFDHIIVQPKTLNAHRLMIYGAKQGREDEIVENLFRAYFLEGANLTDKAALARVGERAGLDRAALAAYLASDDGREGVLRADLEARQASIHGVPCFIFNRRTAVSGAQAPEALLQAMLEARSRKEE